MDGQILYEYDACFSYEENVRLYATKLVDIIFDDALNGNGVCKLYGRNDNNNVLDDQLELLQDESPLTSDVPQLSLSDVNPATPNDQELFEVIIYKDAGMDYGLRVECTGSSNGYTGIVVRTKKPDFRLSRQYVGLSSCQLDSDLPENINKPLEFLFVPPLQTISEVNNNESAVLDKTEMVSPGNNKDRTRFTVEDSMTAQELGRLTFYAANQRKRSSGKTEPAAQKLPLIPDEGDIKTVSKFLTEQCSKTEMTHRLNNHSTSISANDSGYSSRGSWQTDWQHSALRDNPIYRPKAMSDRFEEDQLPVERSTTMDIYPSISQEIHKNNGEQLSKKAILSQSAQNVYEIGNGLGETEVFDTDTFARTPASDRAHVSERALDSDRVQESVGRRFSNKFNEPLENPRGVSVDDGRTNHVDSFDDITVVGSLPRPPMLKRDSVDIYKSRLKAGQTSNISTVPIFHNPDDTIENDDKSIRRDSRSMTLDSYSATGARPKQQAAAVSQIDNHGLLQNEAMFDKRSVMDIIKQEVVILQRLPGEKLGMGLHIEGGKDSKSKVSGVFIEQITQGSPSDALTGGMLNRLKVKDQLLEINGMPLQELSQGEILSVFRELPLRVILTVQRTTYADCESDTSYSADTIDNSVRRYSSSEGDSSSAQDSTDDSDDRDSTTYFKNGKTARRNTPDGFRRHVVLLHKSSKEALGLNVIPSYGSTKGYFQVSKKLASGICYRSHDLKVGDRIYAINGIPLIGIPQTECNSTLKQASGDITLVVLRPDEESLDHDDDLSTDDVENTEDGNYLKPNKAASVSAGIHSPELLRWRKFGNSGKSNKSRRRKSASKNPLRTRSNDKNFKTGDDVHPKALDSHHAGNPLFGSESVRLAFSRRQISIDSDQTETILEPSFNNKIRKSIIPSNEMDNNFFMFDMDERKPAPKSEMRDKSEMYANNWASMNNSINHENTSFQRDNRELKGDVEIFRFHNNNSSDHSPNIISDEIPEYASNSDNDSVLNTITEEHEMAIVSPNYSKVTGAISSTDHIRDKCDEAHVSVTVDDNRNGGDSLGPMTDIDDLLEYLSEEERVINKNISATVDNASHHSAISNDPYRSLGIIVNGSRVIPQKVNLSGKDVGLLDNSPHENEFITDRDTPAVDVREFGLRNSTPTSDQQMSPSHVVDLFETIEHEFDDVRDTKPDNFDDSSIETQVYRAAKLSPIVKVDKPRRKSDLERQVIADLLSASPPKNHTLQNVDLLINAVEPPPPLSPSLSVRRKEYDRMEPNASKERKELSKNRVRNTSIKFSQGDPVTRSENNLPYNSASRIHTSVKENSTSLSMNSSTPDVSPAPDLYPKLQKYQSDINDNSPPITHITKEKVDMDKINLTIESNRAESSDGETEDKWGNPILRLSKRNLRKAPQSPQQLVYDSNKDLKKDSSKLCSSESEPKIDKTVDTRATFSVNPQKSENPVPKYHYVSPTNMRRKDTQEHVPRVDRKTAPKHYLNAEDSMNSLDFEMSGMRDVSEAVVVGGGLVSSIVEARNGQTTNVPYRRKGIETRHGDIVGKAANGDSGVRRYAHKVSSFTKNGEIKGGIRNKSTDDTISNIVDTPRSFDSLNSDNIHASYRQSRGGNPSKIIEPVHHSYEQCVDKKCDETNGVKYPEKEVISKLSPRSPIPKLRSPDTRQTLPPTSTLLNQNDSAQANTVPVILKPIEPQGGNNIIYQSEPKKKNTRTPLYPESQTTNGFASRNAKTCIIEPVAKGKRSDDGPFQIEVMKGILGLGFKISVTPEGFVQIIEMNERSSAGRNSNIRIGDYILCVNNKLLTGMSKSGVDQTLRLLPRGLIHLLLSLTPFDHRKNLQSEETSTNTSTEKEDNENDAEECGIDGGLRLPISFEESPRNDHDTKDLPTWSDGQIKPIKTAALKTYLPVIKAKRRSISSEGTTSENIGVLNNSKKSISKTFSDSALLGSKTRDNVYTSEIEFLTNNDNQTDGMRQKTVLHKSSADLSDYDRTKTNAPTGKSASKFHQKSGRSAQSDLKKLFNRIVPGVQNQKTLENRLTKHSVIFSPASNQFQTHTDNIKQQKDFSLVATELFSKVRKMSAKSKKSDEYYKTAKLNSSSNRFGAVDGKDQGRSASLDSSIFSGEKSDIRKKRRPSFYVSSIIARFAGLETSRKPADAHIIQPLEVEIDSESVKTHILKDADSQLLNRSDINSYECLYEDLTSDLRATFDLDDDDDAFDESDTVQNKNEHEYGLNLSEDKASFQLQNNSTLSENCVNPNDFPVPLPRKKHSKTRQYDAVHTDVETGEDSEGINDITRKNFRNEEPVLENNTIATVSVMNDCDTMMIKNTTRSSQSNEVLSEVNSPGKEIEIVIVKGVTGLGFCVEGGTNSAIGDVPIKVKRVYKGRGAGSHLLHEGDELLKINEVDITNVECSTAWNILKSQPLGPVKLLINRQEQTFSSSLC